MSVTIYDKALITKFKRWIKNQDLTILSPNETKRLFSYKADITNDKPIQLPLISLSRSSTLVVNYTAKRPLSFDGWKHESVITEDSVKNISGKTNQLSAIPITPSYQLDIYTRYEEEAEEYVRNFIFNLVNYPKLSIEIPYNDCSIITDSYITLNENIEDNSDIPERLVPGEFTRKTITFTLNDAYIYDYKTLDNWKIDTGIQFIVKLDDDEQSVIESIDVR